MAGKTYRMLRPVETHFQRVTCEAIDCDHYRDGWATFVDESTSEGMEQAHYIRNGSGRSFTEHRGMKVPGVDGAAQFTLAITDQGPLTVFTFDAGQKCFIPHRDLIEDMEPIGLVLDGVWNNPTGLIRQHQSMDDWADDFSNHQDKIAAAIAEG